MHRRWATRCACSIAFGTAMTLSADARATPDFPQAVVQDLGLPGITVDAPQGCTLCHATDAGGTSLKPFGQLLLGHGVQPYDPSSLKQALDEVAVEQPQLIDDIRAGRDPSTDTTDVHRPEYGCTVTMRGPRQPASSPDAVWLVAGVLICARRLRRSSTPRPRRPQRAAWG